MSRSSIGQWWRVLGLSAAIAVAAAACGSSAATPAAPAPASPAATSPAGSSAAAPASQAVAASQPAAAAADQRTAGAAAALDALKSYKFKFTLKGGSYASSVGPAGVVGTVVNSPSFAVQFTYVDIEVIEIHGKNWTKNGSSWDLSPYPDLPTTYDSYGPAILLSHYFPASIAAYYAPGADETVNGVATTRFTAAPKILNSMAAYWGVKPGATLAGDIWIAKSGGYPVRWKVTGTGTDDFEFLVDITAANAAGNVVHVPAA
jgi:nucleoid-associated protein YgaU